MYKRQIQTQFLALLLTTNFRWLFGLVFSFISSLSRRKSKEKIYTKRDLKNSLINYTCPYRITYWQWKYRSCFKQKALETKRKIEFIAIKTKLYDLILSCRSACICTEDFTFWLTKENLYNEYSASFVLIEWVNIEHLRLTEEKSNS